MRKLSIAGMLICAVLLLFYLFCVHYTDQYQIAIVRNLRTGELYCDTQAGIHFTAPWVQAARIDTRPARVCITSASRAFNCKLVQFEPAYYREFVAVEGFRYYWWANRISFNWGYSDEYRGMKDILRGYAYSLKRYSFVTVLRDYEGPS